MAFDDDYQAYESPSKKSKIKDSFHIYIYIYIYKDGKSKTKDSFHGEGPDSELKIVGSPVAEQVEDKDNKEEIDGNMTSDDEYQKEEDSDLDSFFSHNFSAIPLQCFDFDPLPRLPKIFGLAYPMKFHRDDIFSNRCKEALKYAIEK
ncbi:hypothetical protein GH714_019007 [Hevea brasiliensis]|uniref:Uncharacterized protein n=1 Tax=Hevea brasiliensis TaxID=3981 RepID=A0A6A6LHQ7_HEVBR|nr:hypothetical protein GH714_019007 [Hevea brasiliensis]